MIARGARRWLWIAALIASTSALARAQDAAEQAPEGAEPPPEPMPVVEPLPQDALGLLLAAEDAMTTLDYAHSRELAQRAIDTGGLALLDLTRALRLCAVASAQLGDDAAAKAAFMRLFALEPDAALSTRLSPARRSALLDARGFWGVHKDGFALDASYARPDRELVVRVRDALGWAKTIVVATRFADRPYTRREVPAAGEHVFEIDDIAATDVLEVYIAVRDERGNVVMELGRERDPHVFALSDAELAAIQRRDIRGGQTGSFARRLEELDVLTSVHGFVALELKPVDDVPSFDLHHATLMFRANVPRAASVEVAVEWEHLGLDEDDVYLPHAFIDIELAEWLIVRGGFFEVPVGAFNEYLYPDFLRITGQAPLFSQEVVPALWSEVGLQLRGRVGLGSDAHFTYAAFVANGLEQRDADPEDGEVAEGGELEAMRFNARDSFHGDKAFGGRIGLEVDELDFGVSGYTGRYTIEEDRQLRIADLDMSYRDALFTVRTEGAITFQEVTGETLKKYGLYALLAVRPIAHLEPYAEYDLLDVASRLQRGLLGVALYPMPHARATKSLRLKSEAGWEFPREGDPSFVWFFQLTTGF